MKNKFTKGLLGFLMILLVFTLAACGQDVPDSNQGANETEQPNDSGQENPQDQNQTEGSNEANKQTQDITVYYVDEELINMMEEEQTIEFSSDAEKWASVWVALQTPQQEEHNSLWQNVELLDASLSEGTLTLNIAKPEGTNVGSSGEGFAIQAVLDTYGQIEGVESIQFTVDGQVIETLYGHVTIDEPLNVDQKIIQ